MRKILLRLSLFENKHPNVWIFIFLLNLYTFYQCSQNLRKEWKGGRKDGGKEGEEGRKNGERDRGREDLIIFKKKQKTTWISKWKQNFHTHSIAKLVTRLNPWSLRIRSPLLITLIWHHWLNGLEFGWTPGAGDGRGGLTCCTSWGCKELDMTERLNWLTDVSFLGLQNNFRQWLQQCN